MKIHNANLYKQQRLGSNKKSNNSVANVEAQNFENVDYSKIAFGALYNVKKKRINIEEDKAKLIRQFDSYLKVEKDDEFDAKSYINSALMSILNHLRKIEARKSEIYDQMQDVIKDKKLNEQQRMNIARQLNNELKSLNKHKFKSEPKAKKIVKVDERIDLRLINKFKTAVLEDNYDLRAVYNDYYAELANIKTVEELKEKYPQIKIPSRAETVIAKKIVSTLPRDFFLEMDKMVDLQDAEKLMKYIDDTIVDVIVNLAFEYSLDVQYVYSSLSDFIYEAILEKYKKLLAENAFTTVPVDAKNPLSKIVPNDINLWGIDYDKFVISVIQKHYLEGVKINNIVYEDDGDVIPVGQLKEPEYKFEKSSEKIKGMIVDAESIARKQKDYPNFDENNFKKRLAYYAYSPIGQNESIFETILDFNSCNFDEEDIDPLIIFLRELDDLSDGKKSQQDVEAAIKDKSLKPIGTERLNQLERQRIAEQLHFEQQKNAKLRLLKSKFDATINLLYLNNMNALANNCSKYRPVDLTDEEYKNTDYLAKVVNECMVDKKKKVLDKNAIEKRIMRWDTYNFYSSSNANNKALQDGIAYSAKEVGSVSPEKVGQYIINYEIISNYPENSGALVNSELIAKIIEKSKNKEEAVNTLCKYDKYKELSDKARSEINAFIDIFDEKNPADKAVLRYIVENDYVMKDTLIKAKIRENSDEAVDVIFAASAKQDILDKYKYPICLEFLTGFEEAMGYFAPPKGSSGIKKLESNQKSAIHKYEVKLIGHDDRLFADDDRFIFDIFSDKGLH